MEEVNPVTGELMNRTAQIRARLDGRDQENWKVSKYGNHMADVVSTEHNVEMVVCEHAGLDALFISQAPKDIAYLLGRLESVEKLLARKIKDAATARNDARWERSKGRITSSFAHDELARLLDLEAEDLKKALSAEQ